MIAGHVHLLKPNFWLYINLELDIAKLGYIEVFIMAAGAPI